MRLSVVSRGFILLVQLALAGTLPQAGVARAQDAPIVVYLVRHAEKLDDTRDPPLTEAGKARAAELARVLGDAGITHVWSTDFDRTRSTAAPTAHARGIAVRSYDPSKSREFVGELLRTPGRHLVVGHSNTTPALVEALGGEPGTPIADSEYDRLYLVVLSGSGAVTSLLRFGATASR